MAIIKGTPKFGAATNGGIAPSPKATTGRTLLAASPATRSKPGPKRAIIDKGHRHESYNHTNDRT